MARFGGYPGMGGGNNMNQLLRQAKQMQEDMMKTHSEIEAKEFDITRERIRQIEAKALRKLRHPSRSKKLKDFLTD